MAVRSNRKLHLRYSIMSLVAKYTITNVTLTARNVSSSFVPLIQLARLVDLPAD